MKKNNNFSFNTIPYEYRNAPVPGGGFVTGLVFHPNVPNILYARTDIGGTYRYNFERKFWDCLIDGVTEKDSSECNPLSIALDKNNCDALYVACGDAVSGRLSVSMNNGDSFKHYSIPCGIHGNSPGRSTGERLIVDSNNSNVIYFGSQTAGLLRSLDGGKSWSNITVGENNEKDITFVFIDERNIYNGMSKTIFVATSGAENSNEKYRGHSLYYSNDCGNTFIKAFQPDAIKDEVSLYFGFVGQRCSFDGKYLYVTFSASGTQSRNGFSNYGCDSGSALYGAIYRYKLDNNGDIVESIDVSPNFKLFNNIMSCGFAGICVDPIIEGKVICTTQCRHEGDIFFVSNDFGMTWSPILHGLNIGDIRFSVPYMKPKYNNNGSLIHWISDIKINPFNNNQAVFNTGTGIFMTENLKSGDCFWFPACDGVEETVHLNVYCPPEGEVKLIDIIGDLGGFAFTDLDKPCENSFADADGNRYITCMNADFPDTNPNTVVVTPRGNWSGRTTGGVIISDDQCNTWKSLSHPYKLSTNIDKLLDKIIQPNTNSGWVAINADSTAIVWTVASGFRLPATAVVYTNDRGDSWHQSIIINLSGNVIENNEKYLKVMSDRVNPKVFYGFGRESEFYVSIDGGKSFYQHETPKDFPIINLSDIDGRNIGEIRVESYKEGVIWIATGVGGLWKIIFDKNKNNFSAVKISTNGDSASCVGLGLGKNENKAVFIVGTISGVYGFWQSLDEGKSWSKINNDKQNFGRIRSITGDARIFGRIYLATGTRGVIYGDFIK